VRRPKNSYSSRLRSRLVDEPMKKSLALVAIAVIVFVFTTVLLIGSHHSTEQRLPDGTTLRLQKVSFGKREPFQPSSRLQQLKNKVMVLLQEKWKKTPPKTSGLGRSSWNQLSIIHTNNDALQIWISRYDPVSSRYQDTTIQMAEILDAHGCPFLATQTGGEGD